MKNHHAYFLLLITLLCGAVSVGASAPHLPSGFVVLDDCPFIVCSEMRDSTELTLDDSQFNAMATGIRFRVNRTEIDTTQEFFSVFNDQVINYLRNQHFQIEKLFIRGAASPEGPYLNNQRLGRGRTAALFSLIEKKLSAPDAPMPKVDSQAIIEDYRYLVDLMMAADDPDVDRVREAMESCDWDERCCKKSLQSLDNGRLWKRLLEEYFPTLRSARVVIWVKRYELPAAGKIVEPARLLDVPKIDPLAAMEGKSVLLPGWKYYRRPVMAIRTNLVRDLFYMPKFGFAPSLDVQLEFFPVSSHYTANFAFSWSNWRKWNQQKFFQIRDAQIEVRRYFKEKGQYFGPFVGIYAEGLVYGVGLNAEQGWQGEGWGAGFDIGYSLRLTKQGHLRMEFGLKLGYLGSIYDPYVYGNPITGAIDGDYYYNYLGAASQFRKRNHLFTWIGPTDLSIALTYDIAYHTRGRKASKENGTYNWYPVFLK